AAGKDGADENGVARQGIAHVLDETDHLHIAPFRERMTGRRVAADDDQPCVRTRDDDERPDIANEPLERLAIRYVPEAAQKKQRAGFAAVGIEAVTRGVDSGAESALQLWF